MEDLWKIRLRKQMSVAQLSSRAGIPARLIHEYEMSQRSIPMKNMEKLARALFVDVMDIKSLSDPIPPDMAFRSRREPRERVEQGPPRPREPRPRPSTPKREQPPVPARESQINHLLMLAKRFGWDRTGLEDEIGKPLAELTRSDASGWLKQLQERIVAEAPQKVKKRRPYLPESVDTFELRYLQSRQEEETTLAFKLFNGETHVGKIVGFGPYSITIKGETEVTLNKLAIAYYRKVEEESS